MTEADVLDVRNRALAHLQTWSPARLVQHGLDYFAAFDSDGSAARRRHARTVLATEHLLGGDLFAGFDAPLVLLKGREVAALYESPTHRHFRDIDVLTSSPEELWQLLRSRGFQPNPTRRADIDHHHLPALLAPDLPVAVEVHRRVNTPAWMQLDPSQILDDRQPSRILQAGLCRPMDDVHALVMAAHCWKAGFTRLRDLLDVLLLNAVSERPPATMASELGLQRMWAVTMRVARSTILGERDAQAALILKFAASSESPVDRRRINRLVLPYLVANPVHVTRSHVSEYRLGRAARSDA